ncbi:hypothetical protein PRK78_001559 [Emydomyces testavorans]|uniref:Telomeric single stranded DNA binding POT1/Cdc13 domain-containing protein n=1 Tax=Emydomyces testavorans TaxID=2070801 RepID=A0AAF0DCR7_9EURO|nr:hypothetical protein PRK78_001559 [Emydomyces testavorans]
MEHLSTSSLLSAATAIPIASLSPSVPDLEQRYISAVVILLWPFSSSTKQCSLLLSEPDFRLRELKGQVKVCLHNGAAEAVAKSRIGIGDIVYLSLAGAKWKRVDGEGSDSICGINWDLDFEHRVLLEASHSETYEAPEELVRDVSAPTTDVRARSPSPLKSATNVWSSPAFARSLPPSIIGDTAEEDGFILGKGRKRTKFGRLSSEWVYLDSPPSPVKAGVEMQQEDVSEAQSNMENASVAFPSLPMKLNAGSVAADKQAEYERLPKVSTPPNSSVSINEKGHATNILETAHVDHPMDLSHPLETNSIPEQQLSSVEIGQNSARTEHIPDAFDTAELANSQHISYQADESGVNGWPEINSPHDITWQPLKDIEAMNESLQYISTRRESIVMPPDLSSSPPQIMRDAEENSVPEEAISGSSASIRPKADANMIRSQSVAMEGLEVENVKEYLSGPETEAVIESDLLKNERLELARAEETEYSESEDLSEEEADSDVSHASLESKNRPTSSGAFGILSPVLKNPEHYEMPRISASRTPYFPEVIILDNDEEVDSSRLDAARRPERNQSEIEEQPEGVNITTYASESHQQKFVETSVSDAVEDTPGSEPSVQAQQPKKKPEEICTAPDFMSQQEGHIRGLSFLSTSEIDGSLEEAIFPLAKSETSPEESTSSESHANRMLAANPALFLDGASSESVNIEWSRCENLQLVTPNNTQDSRVSFSQSQMSPMHAVQTLPTPELSQQGQVSRLSFSESICAAGTDLTFNSVLEGSIEVSQPVAAGLREPASPSPSRSVQISGVGQKGHAEINREDASAEDTEAASNSKALTPLRSQEPSSGVSSAVTEISNGHENHLDHVAGLRTKLSYFSPLSLLGGNFNRSTDTISAVASASPVSRASRNPRDYFITIHITDSSMGGDVVCVQVFCSNKAFLPTCTQGDIILLRNFKVGSVDHKMMLSSMDDSSWAVFVQGAQENVQINGPPVEFGDEEQAYVTSLRQWYMDGGEDLIAEKTARPRESGSAETSSSIAPSESGSVSSRGQGNIFKKYRRKRKSTPRRITVHELRGGRRYLDVTSPSDKESIHELRDGTVYAHL